jgi:hypothetical protein
MSNIIYAYKPLYLADFTWVNQGSTYVQENCGGLMITSPSNGGINAYQCLVKTAPSTPYKVVAHFSYLGAYAVYTSYGMMWRESSSGKIVALNYWTRGAGKNYINIVPMKMNSPTSENSEESEFNVLNQDWMMLEDTGTTRNVYTSFDGINWSNIYTKTRTDFITPDQFGVCTNPYSLVCGVHVTSFKLITSG